MAPQLENSSHASEEEALDTLDEVHHINSLPPMVPTEDYWAPVTNGDILNLMKNIQTFFKADLDMVREKLVALIDKIKTMEDDMANNQQDSQAQQASLVHKSLGTLQARIDSLDYGRGVTEEVEEGKLPHFIRLPPPAKAYTWMSSPTASPQDSFSFQTLGDKLAVVSAVKDETRIQSETMQLAFLQDLCRSTLLWRRSLSSTKRLQDLNVRYRWWSNRNLIADANGTQHKLTSEADSAVFLQACGLHQGLGLH
ncbi:Hypothetical predicted protein [Pelobates cultripes]|uniref:Uncharacterized protein n=1 Tax=Pelobates cultripes TaxID=61616 RepID=A0AAD1WCC6_PELCU|nr:Hypothetical predicted protein [Pelobates cultripes]